MASGVRTMPAGIDESTKQAFVAVFETPQASPADIPLDWFPGLSNVQVLQNVQSSALPDLPTHGIYSVWDREGDFRSNGGRFLDQLQQVDSSARLVWSGSQQKSMCRHTTAPRWYEQFVAKWAIFASVVAALGTIEAFRNHYFDLFERPDVQEMSPGNTLDVLSTDPW